MAFNFKLGKLLLICFLTADWGQAPVEGAKLNSKLANDLCNNLENYKSSKEMAAPLKKPSQAGAGGGSSSNLWLSWRSCEGLDNSCEPFSFSTAPPTDPQGKPSNQRPSGQGPEGATPTSESEYKPKVIVTLKSKMSCKRIARSAGTVRSAHIRTIVDDLKAHAAKSQAKVMEILEPKARSGDFKLDPLWITNEIAVEGSSVEAVTSMLQGSTDVESIELEEMWPLVRPVGAAGDNSNRQTRTHAPVNHPQEVWHAVQMRVPEVWAAGFNGSGVRLANIDTGVYLEHPDLRDSYANDGFSWFDPNLYTKSPNDNNGHGTRTMGIMVGSKYNMGVAPGATWMACKSCTSSDCPSHATKKCLQWVICPTDPNGGKEDCSKAPRIVNCSWGIRTELTDNPVYRRNDDAIECIRSAGIIPVFAMGNDGDKFQCHAASYPASLPNVIGVGNSGRIRGLASAHPDYAQLTNLSILIANSSSPGPAHPDYNAGIKPEVMAPGVQIWAPQYRRDPSQPEIDLYGFDVGTSYSAPCVAGTIALMLQRNPDLNFNQIKAALISSCTPVYFGWVDRACAGISETIHPNHRSGYGSIDAYDAVFNTFEVNNATDDNYCELG